MSWYVLAAPILLDSMIFLMIDGLRRRQPLMKFKEGFYL